MLHANQRSHLGLGRSEKMQEPGQTGNRIMRIKLNERTAKPLLLEAGASIELCKKECTSVLIFRKKRQASIDPLIRR